MFYSVCENGINQSYQWLAVSITFSLKAVVIDFTGFYFNTLEPEGKCCQEKEYEKLPRVKNVYYLAGMKFGASGNQPLTS